MTWRVDRPIVDITACAAAADKLRGGARCWSAGALMIVMALAFFGAGLRPVQAQSAPSSDSRSHAGGERLYETYCSVCHGDRGQGYVADNAVALSNQDFLRSVSNAFLRRSISNGRPNTPMAAYAERHGGPMSDPEINALVDFIRGWQREPMVVLSSEPVAGEAGAGRLAFSEHCADCHGPNGEGQTAVSLNNPEFLAAALDGQIRHAIIGGRRDTQMPSFGETLPGRTIDDLVAMIRSWQTDGVRKAAASLSTGAERIVLNPDGAVPRFELRDSRYVPADQLDAAMRGKARLVLLDARPPSDWKLWHIPGAVSAPHYDPATIIERLPDDGTWIISYCACPTKLSDQLTDSLREAGFENTAVLAEGVIWWKANGYPVVSASD